MARQPSVFAESFGHPKVSGRPCRSPHLSVLARCPNFGLEFSYFCFAHSFPLRVWVEISYSLFSCCREPPYRTMLRFHLSFDVRKWYFSDRLGSTTGKAPRPVAPVRHPEDCRCQEGRYRHPCQKTPLHLTPYLSQSLKIVDGFAHNRFSPFRECLCPLAPLAI